MFVTKTMRGLLAGITMSALALGTPAMALELLAPSNPGSGWDQTARALQGVLDSEKLASNVQVVNVGGGGGTIGLAQFVTTSGGRDDTMLLSGLAMVSGVLINQSAVTLDEVRPLARLIGEYEVIVVPASSPIKDIKELMDQFKADPRSVSWGAGSAGSADHLLMGLIAQAAGVPAIDINYIGHSGGGEALAAILGGHVTAGISGYQEFASQIASGDLRALAISAPEAVEGIDIPTFAANGYDIDFVNWRGLMAPADISEEGFTALSAMVDKAVASPAWATVLADRGWLSLYQPADEFSEFLAANRAQTEETLRAIGLVN